MLFLIRTCVISVMKSQCASHYMSIALLGYIVCIFFKQANLPPGDTFLVDDDTIK